MILLLFALFTFQVNAQTPDLKAAPVAPTEPVSTPVPAEATPAESDVSEDYQVDYEEEPGSEEVEEPAEEAPVAVKSKKTKGKKNVKESVTQGSRAEKKIAPMMKSETKSIYKKNGKSLDVDSD